MAAPGRLATVRSCARERAAEPAAVADGFEVRRLSGTSLTSKKHESKNSKSLVARIDGEWRA